jgi:RNA polymerase sigma factor (sigma-70 family)
MGLRGTSRLLETSLSLLERLRLNSDPASWDRLVALYTPLIRNWLARQSVQSADIDDLTQEVLGRIVRALPSFCHDLQRGAFRRWLRTITMNQLRSFWRSQRSSPESAGSHNGEAALAQLEDPNSDLSRLWDEEHDRHVIRRLLELIEPEFEPITWAAFRFLVFEGRAAPEAEAALGISANAARIAKSRVLNRLRKEAVGFLD